MSEGAEITIPPSERKEIVKMGDAFREAMKKPQAIAPAPPPPAPAATPKPAPAGPKDDPATKLTPKLPAASPATAPAPAPVPVPEAKPSDPEPEMPKNAKDWKAFKELKAKADAEAKQATAEAAALKAEAAAQKAELETLKKGSAEWERVKADYEGTKKQLTDQQKILDIVALEHNPKFQEHYTNRIKGYAESIKGFLAGEVAGKVDQIFALPPSRLRDEQIKALVTELDETDRVAATAISNAYVNMAVVERERATELGRASENVAQWKASEQKRHQEEQAARQSHLNAVLDLANQQTAADLEGAEQADAVSFKEDTRRLVYGELDQPSMLRIATYASKGRKYDKTIAERDEMIAKLQTQVAELTSASPPANGTGGGQHIPNRRGPADNTDIGNRFRAEMAKKQGQR